MRMPSSVSSRHVTLDGHGMASKILVVTVVEAGLPMVIGLPRILGAFLGKRLHRRACLPGHWRSRAAFRRLGEL